MVDNEAFEYGNCSVRRNSRADIPESCQGNCCGMQRCGNRIPNDKLNLSQLQNWMGN